MSFFLAAPLRSDITGTRRQRLVVVVAVAGFLGSFSRVCDIQATDGVTATPTS